MDLTVIILAGGKSSRMGEEKGLVHYQGKPLIEYSIDLASKLTNNIIISSACEAYQSYGFKLIPDLHKSIGPMGGIFSCMQAAAAEYYFVISCDIPEASLLLAKQMLAAAGMADAIVPVHSGGKIEPLFAFYSATTLPVIKLQVEAGNFKMMDLLENVRTYYYNTEDLLQKNPAIFKNINTKADVE